MTKNPQDRKVLAFSYVELLMSQSGRPIALSCEDDEAMATFLAEDLNTVAKSKGFLVVKIDLRPHLSQPIMAINARLEEELDSLVGAEQSLPDQLSDVPAFRFDSLVNRINSLTTVLLILENFDALLEGPAPRDMLGAIRAVLQIRKPRLAAIFTSSSRTALTPIFGLRTEPMYLFAHQRDLPLLRAEHR